MIELNDLLPESEQYINWTFYGEEHDGVPDGKEYVVFEYYCDNKDCDCKRLIAEIFTLGDDGEPVKKSSAIVHYDWNSDAIRCHPTLTDESPKDPLAFSILEVYKKFTHDEEYLARIKYQYARVKELSGGIDTVNHNPPFIPYSNPNKNIGRNDPCPCGSGKKYKKCCRIN